MCIISYWGVYYLIFSVVRIWFIMCVCVYCLIECERGIKNSRTAQTKMSIAGALLTCGDSYIFRAELSSSQVRFFQMIMFSDWNSSARFGGSYTHLFIISHLHHKMKGVFQWIQKSEIAEIPRNMNIVISQIFANIFIPYLTVVWDFGDMFCSTYDIIVNAQKTIAE